MKFYCDKSDLLSAAQIAGRAVSQKSSELVLEGLLLQTAGSELVLSGYDRKIGIRTRIEVEVETPGSVVINSKLFLDIIRNMPSERLTIECTNLTMKISCFASEFEIMGIAEEFPEIPGIDTDRQILIPENTLKSIIGDTIFAVSLNNNRVIQTGSLFDLNGAELTVVSCDNYRLALRRESIAAANPQLVNAQSESFVVPGNMLTEIKNICADSDELAAMSVGARYIMCKVRSTEIISRKLEGEFLDYKRSIPETFKTEIEVDRKAFMSCVERVSLLISDVIKSPLRVAFNDGFIKFRTMTAVGNRANDECMIKGDGGGLEIGFNNRYVLDALKAAPADELRLKFNSAISPCVISSADDENLFLYMILPVRLASI